MSSSKFTDWKIAVVYAAILVMILMVPAIAATVDNIGDTDIKSDARPKINHPQGTSTEIIDSEKHVHKPPSKDDESRNQDLKEKTGKDDQGKEESGEPGDVFYIPSAEKHAILNAGNEDFVFLCIIPYLNK